MDTAFLITGFVTMFVVIDPPGLAPLFLVLTQGMSAQARRAVGIRACLVAIGVLAMFAAFGEAVLGFVGISMAAFRVAGGILLFLTALDMLFERRTKRREDQTDAHPDDPSVFPLAVPLIAGPGAIASIILLAGQKPGWEGLALAILVMVAVMAVAMVFLELSGLIGRGLGKTGINVVTRLLGMLLAALSVQFVLDGLRAFGFASGA
ncbi:MarC family protein [Seohaeicola nanhaiensis]|uniref:UPF0056 membrane protein n=1 Tax=Seohaeicola nanhaiensis TaxID=1387282 RepID=A0ABV9KFI1_9RHOB